MKRSHFFLLIASIIFSILAAEGVLRVYYRLTNSVLEDLLIFNWSSNDEDWDGIYKPSQNRKIVYELAPNLDTQFMHVPLRTNSKGWREENIPVEKKDRTIRIAGLGDSHMFGFGVNVEDRYMDVLEGILNIRHPEYKWEMIVFACPGYNAAMELEVLKGDVLDYDPDAVIYAYIGNDLCLPFFGVPKKDVWGRESFLKHYMLRFMARMNWHDVPPEYNAVYEICNPKYLESPYNQLVGKENFMKALFEMERLSLQESFKFMFLAPLRDQFDTERFEEVKGELKHTHFIFFPKDLRDYYEKNGFEGYLDSDLKLSEHDPHPSAKGHYLKAELIYEQLKKSGLLKRLMSEASKSP